jgi:putative membrane protein
VSLLVRWLLNALALFGIAYAAPRIGVLPGFKMEGFVTAIVAVAIIAVLNLTVKPILKILTLPVTCLTFGLFALVINAIVMLLASELVTGFEVGGFVNALMASIIYAILSTIFNMFINPKGERD